MAKLTKEQWSDAQTRWERNKKTGFDWLAKELGVDRSLVSKKAKAENWTKKVTLGGEKSHAKVTQKVTQTSNDKNSENSKLINSKPPLKVVGRPEQYRDNYCDYAYDLSLLGLTNEELAEYFEVSVGCLAQWRKKHVEFNDAILKGRLLIEGRTANALFDAALGLNFIVEERDSPDGITTIKKQLPPSIDAQKFILKNRQPNKWRDKQEVDNNMKIDGSFMDFITTQFEEQLKIARERNKQVLIERGILIEGE